MKKAIKLTLAVVLVMGATSLFAQKFGRINTQEIIVGMPETKEMQTNMEAYAKDLQDNLESMTVEYNQKLQEFQKNFNTLSESVRQLKENDLNALIQRRNEFEQAAQQDFQKRQNELLAPIIEKAKNAIDKVAAAGGYLAVFDTSTGSLAYFDEASLTDIAPAVKKELGITDAPAAAAAPAHSCRTTHRAAAQTPSWHTAATPQDSNDHPSDPLIPTSAGYYESS